MSKHARWARDASSDKVAKQRARTESQQGNEERDTDEERIPHAPTSIQGADGLASAQVPVGQQAVGHASSGTPEEEPLILVAEDDEPIAQTIALLLEDAGYWPIVAANGREALKAAHAQWPTLVITDLMMPHMNGRELIAALRTFAAANGHPMPPVVLLTAAHVITRHSEELDVAAIVYKPFDIVALETTVRELLRAPTNE